MSDDPPKTPPGIAELLAKQAEQIAALTAQVQGLTELQHELLRQRQESSRLPSGPKDSSIVVDMTANNATAISPDTMGRPLVTDHPFPRRLKALGSNVEVWAIAHDVHPKKVRSWYQTKGPRRIPRHHAETIEREMGLDEDGKPYVPANLATWPNGIR